MLRALGRQTRVERERDADLLEDFGCTADVVALRMREDERRQARDAERAKLPGDVAFRRPLVDEYRSLGDLEENGVALAHVEERDPKPARRWRLGTRA